MHLRELPLEPPYDSPAAERRAERYNDMQRRREEIAREMGRCLRLLEELDEEDAELAAELAEMGVAV